jgi:hypothetical protein
MTGQHEILRAQRRAPDDVAAPERMKVHAAPGVDPGQHAGPEPNVVAEARAAGDLARLGAPAPLHRQPVLPVLDDEIGLAVDAERRVVHLAAGDHQQPADTHVELRRVEIDHRVRRQDGSDVVLPVGALRTPGDRQIHVGAAVVVRRLDHEPRGTDCDVFACSVPSSRL